VSARKDGHTKLVGAGVLRLGPLGRGQSLGA
jgi:hypothetical protein